MEGTLAQIIIFAGNFAPRNWAFCDGRIMPIANNESLYSLLGTMYGGDGRTTFALPDLRNQLVDQGQDKTPMNYVICLQGLYPSRD